MVEADLGHESPVLDLPSVPGRPEGGSGPVLAVLHRRTGQPEGERLQVRVPDVLLGRIPGNQVVISDPSVSARHARLRLGGGVWTLADLGSVGGSAVDGEPVASLLPLAPGSAIRLGGVDLVFSPHDRWEDSPIPPELLGPHASEPPADPSRLPVVIGVLILVASAIGFFLLRAG